MTTKEKDESKVPEEMESDAEVQENVRRGEERSQWEDLNQGMETGTHDSRRGGIRWGRHYKLRKKKSQPNSGSTEKK